MGAAPSSHYPPVARLANRPRLARRRSQSVSPLLASALINAKSSSGSVGQSPRSFRRSLLIALTQSRPAIGPSTLCRSSLGRMRHRRSKEAGNHVRTCEQTVASTEASECLLRATLEPKMRFCQVRASADTSKIAAHSNVHLPRPRPRAWGWGWGWRWRRAVASAAVSGGHGKSPVMSPQGKVANCVQHWRARSVQVQACAVPIDRDRWRARLSWRPSRRWIGRAGPLGDAMH